MVRPLHALHALVLPALLVGVLGSLPLKAQGGPEALATQTVRFPGRAEEPADRRSDFSSELLALALERSGDRLRLELVGGMNTPRRVEAARQGRVDVVTLPHHAEATSGLIAVRHPLQRGLLGVRVLLARPETAERLMTIGSIEELKRDFVMGYGSTWIDREILANLGFRMVHGPSYTGLFDMLRADRFDYLTRSVGELAAERADPRLAGEGLVVVPGVALYYPLDHYFHVSPQRPALARALERGLRRAQADGSYAALFKRHFGGAMADIGLEQRSIIHVLGYPVPRGTPLEQFDVLGFVRSTGVFHPPAAEAVTP